MSARRWVYFERCSCGDRNRARINHRKTIPCWTYMGDKRVDVDSEGRVVEVNT